MRPSKEHGHHDRQNSPILLIPPRSHSFPIKILAHLSKKGEFGTEIRISMRPTLTTSTSSLTSHPCRSSFCGFDYQSSATAIIGHEKTLGRGEACRGGVNISDWPGMHPTKPDLSLRPNQFFFSNALSKASLENTIWARASSLSAPWNFFMQLPQQNFTLAAPTSTTWSSLTGPPENGQAF